ncbi:MAG: GTPase [candidate division WOR-3 bacterium]
MPANLSPEYKKAEEKYRAATTPEEKLVCLEEMLQTIPKHKGTEKMQADIKTRIAKLRRELSRSKSSSKRSDWYHIEKQGAGQLAVFGAPNCGKSSLVRSLTCLPTEVAPYPFTTTKPAAGMMRFEDIQIQLIDTPPIAAESPAWLFHILRTCDVAVWLFDLSTDDLLETTEQVAQLLAANRVTFQSDTELNAKPLIRVGTKIDDPQAHDRLSILRELIGNVPVLLTSSHTGQGLDEFRSAAFSSLRVIRVYTKRPGHPPDMDEPVILKTNSTVIDAAYHLHKDFAKKLNYARLWNQSGYSGRRVEHTHVLMDKDIVEFHINE